MTENDKAIWLWLCELGKRLHGEIAQHIEDGRFSLKFEDNWWILRVPDFYSAYAAGRHFDDLDLCGNLEIRCGDQLFCRLPQKG